MKVILGTESFPPNVSGVATATVNLAENLTKAGHEVFVFTPGKTFKSKSIQSSRNTLFIASSRSSTLSAAATGSPSPLTLKSND